MISDDSGDENDTIFNKARTRDKRKLEKKLESKTYNTCEQVFANIIKHKEHVITIHEAEKLQFSCKICNKNLSQANAVKNILTMFISKITDTNAKNAGKDSLDQIGYKGTKRHVGKISLIFISTLTIVHFKNCNHKCQ